MTTTHASARLYQKLVARPMTGPERGFDILFGVVAPIVCFYFDRIFFRGGFEGPPIALDFRSQVYVFAALQLVTLSSWLAFGPRLGRRLAGTCAGVLLAGAAFAAAFPWAIALIDSKTWSLWTVAFGFFLALPMWPVFFSYLRNAVRAFYAASRGQSA